MVCLYSRSTRQDPTVQGIPLASPLCAVHDSAMAAESADINCEVSPNEADLVICHPVAVGGYIPQGSAYHAPIKETGRRCGRLELRRWADRSRQVHHGAYALQGVFNTRVRVNGGDAQVQGHRKHVVGDTAGRSNHQAAYSIGDIQ